MGFNRAWNRQWVFSMTPRANLSGRVSLNEWGPGGLPRQVPAKVWLTSPDGGCKGRCRSWTRRPRRPALGAAPRKSPEQEGTAAKAARRSPAGAERTAIPVGCGRGRGPSGRSAAGTGVPPGETHSVKKRKWHFQHFIFMQATQNAEEMAFPVWVRL